MKKRNIFNSLALFGLALTFVACSGSNEVASNKIITKRKHNPGFHINWPSNWSKSDQDVAKKEIDRSQEKEIHVENKQYEAQVMPVVSSPRDISFQDGPELNTYSAPIVIEREEVADKQAVGAKEVVSLKKTSKKEQRAVKKELKKLLKKESKNSNSDVNIVLLYVLCFFIPFVAVGLVTDWDIKKVLLNILLTILCGIPGIIHAIIVVHKNA